MKKIFDSVEQPGERVQQDYSRFLWTEQSNAEPKFRELGAYGEVDVLSVEVASKTYLIDRESLQETTFVRRKNLERFPGKTGNIFLSQLRGRPLPVQYLGDLLGLEAVPSESGGLLIWKFQRALSAILVDKLLEPKTINLGKLKRTTEMKAGVLGESAEGELLVDLRILEPAQTC